MAEGSRHMRQGLAKRREQASHADDWLMTYADMITLLLCFFAIFLSISIRQKTHTAQPLQHDVKHMDSSKDDWALERLASPAPAATELRAAPASTVGKSDSFPKSTTKSAAPTGAVAPETVDKSYAALLEIVNRLKQRGPSSIEQQGDRITTLQMSSAAFFDRGSAALNYSGRAILKNMAVSIQSARYRHYQVTVEGHTDDSPIRTPQFPSNWELSTARAAAVVHFFLQQGIPAQRLRAAGYADTFPVVPNRTANGNAIPENQARNRRVVIKLEKIEKAE